MANKGEVNLILKARDQATRVIQGLSGQLKKFGSEAKELFGNKLTQILSLGSIIAGLKAVTAETLKWDQSLRNLSGAAKITGAPLDFIQSIASRVRKEVSTSKIEANDFAEALVKLAAKAGDLTLVEKNFTAIFDVLAAQGFSGAEALRALEAAVQGNDRVIKKLFNQRPDELYERFAQSINKTAGELTAAERAQAVFNQFAITGAKTQGELAKQLASTGEVVGDVGEALSDAAVAFGEDLRPAIELTAKTLIFLIKMMSGFVKGVGAFGSFLGAIFFSIQDAILGVVTSVERLMDGDFAGAKDALAGIGTNIKNNFAGAFDAVKESFSSLDAEVTTYDRNRLDAANKQLRLEKEKEAELAKQKQHLKEMEELEKANLARQREQRIEAAGGGNKLLTPGLDAAVLASLAAGQPGQAGSDAVPSILSSGRTGSVNNRGESPISDQIKKAREETEEFEQALRDAIAGPLSDFFAKGLQGFDNFGEAVKEFGRAVAQTLANLAAQLAANFLLKQLFGGAAGGGISLPGFASGGIVSGPGGPTQDNLLALLSNGEAVLNAKAVQAVGPGFIEYLNSLGGPGGQRIPRFADGGIAGAAQGGDGANGSLTVGLEDGLVMRHLETPSGQRGLVRILSKNRNAVNGVLRR